jgi:hypothetical protein
MYHKILQFVEYMDIYVDVCLVYKELLQQLQLQTDKGTITGAQIREAVMKYSRGKKNRCPTCGVDLGESSNPLTVHCTATAAATDVS